jgi:hypothetical protein
MRELSDDEAVQDGQKGFSYLVKRISSLASHAIGQCSVFNFQCSIEHSTLNIEHHGPSRFTSNASRIAGGLFQHPA